MSDPFEPLRELASSALAACVSAAERMAQFTTTFADFRLPELPFVIVDGDPTGETPINDVLQGAIDGANGRPVYVKAGRHRIDPTRPIQLRSGLTLLLDPQAILVVQPNSLPRYAVLLGEGVEDVRVEGGQIVGDRVEHTYALIDGKANSHEWGMGVQIKRSKRVTLRNIVTRYCTGDGFSVSGEDIHLVDCVALYNRRQGLSIYSGRSVRVIRGQYAYTGQPVPGDASGAIGTKPMCGIDVEPDGGEAIDVLIDAPLVHDNRSSGILAWSRSEARARIDLRIRNAQLARNTHPVEAAGLGGAVAVDVQDCHMEQHTGAFGAQSKTGATIAFDRNTVLARSPRTDSNVPGRYDLLTRSAPEGAPPGVFVVGTNNHFQ